VFNYGARETLQYLSQPRIGRTQKRILCRRVSKTGQARHVCDQRDARKCKAEVVTCHNEREESDAQAREGKDGKSTGRRRLQDPSNDERTHLPQLQRAVSTGGDAYKRGDKPDGSARCSDLWLC